MVDAEEDGDGMEEVAVVEDDREDIRVSLREGRSLCSPHPLTGSLIYCS